MQVKKYVLYKYIPKEDPITIFIDSFDSLEDAHRARLKISLKNQFDTYMLMNKHTQKHYEWRKRELGEFESKKEVD